MTNRNEIQSRAEHTEAYLRQTLLPFWLDHGWDSECGGFLTYFDGQGRPTGETTKTFLMQIRMLFTFSSAHRAGYGDGRCGDLARRGAEFILRHYWDKEHTGWIWIADRNGNPIVSDKVGYGQSFALYAFSEYFLATGDHRGRQAALDTYTAICSHMIDTRHGGFYEIMQADWQPAAAGKCGGDRKSMDVHMHMMEALTTFYEMSGCPTYRRRLLEVIDILTSQMLHAEYGTGYMQYSLDFQPLPAIIFDVQWGRDAEPEQGPHRPLDHTSYGHNVEFIWLLLHAADILGLPRRQYAQVVRRICDQCLEYGIDWEYGGVFVEGPHNGPTTLTEKQFWQQAEVMIGLLDAYMMFNDDRYWQAFCNIYDFVFEKFVNLPAGGEWYERLDRFGNPIDNALAHAWKINYHTVRSMIQVVQRLNAMAHT